MALHPFNKRLERLPNTILTLIAKIDEYKGQWIAGAKLSPQILGRLKKSVLVTSTGASTRIEGAHLSNQDIEKLMKGLSIQKFKDRDKQEVQSYYELLQEVFELWKHMHFSESLIKHFHRETLKYVEKDKRHKGEYKKQENKVMMVNEAGQSMGVLFDTTPAYLVQKEMQELIEWTQHELTNAEYHPLLIIGNFIVEFLQIHPFQDGNGRLSRVLTNLLLLHAGYQYMPYVSHEKIVEDNKPDYYMALRKSQKTFKTKKPSITQWLTFFLSCIRDQSKHAIQLISRESIEKLLSPKQLLVWEYMQTVTEASPKELVEGTGVSRPTINQICARLMELKKIERIGMGRATRYRML